MAKGVSEEVIEFLKKQEDFDDAEMGPPPFRVKLPTGEYRHVVHKPA